MPHHNGGNRDPNRISYQQTEHLFCDVNRRGDLKHNVPTIGMMTMPPNNSNNNNEIPTRQEQGSSHKSNNKKSLAVLGTGSDVGKSILAAALCRILIRHRPDLRVAPFKGQNMSNNAYPALTQQGDYGEIGIAQAIQARACRQVPVVEVRKNIYRCVGVCVHSNRPPFESRASLVAAIAFGNKSSGPILSKLLGASLPCSFPLFLSFR